MGQLPRLNPDSIADQNTTSGDPIASAVNEKTRDAVQE
jgi:hypothetical protein